MCRPREPEVLRSPSTPSASSSSRTQRATSRTRENGAPVHRIQIDRGEVHLVRRLRAREPGVLRDHRELGHVEQRRQVAADEPRRDVVARDALARARRAGRLGRAVLVEGGPSMPSGSAS